MSPDFRSEDADERLWDCASRHSGLIIAGWQEERNGAKSGDRACGRARCERGKEGERKEQSSLLSFTVGLLDDGCKDGLQFHHSNWMNYMCSS